MTPPQIQSLARQHAARHESDPTMSTEDCIAAAIVEAITKDREADDRLKDDRLFLPVDFVQQQNKVYEERIAQLQAELANVEGKLRSVAAGLSFVQAQDGTLEMCARRIYAERDDAVRRLERYIQEMPEWIVQAKVKATSLGPVEP